MTKPAITAILLGAMLFVLGMMPGLIRELIEGVQNFFDYISPVRGRFRGVPADLRNSGNIWLLAGGGALMIAGLLALLAG